MANNKVNMIWALLNEPSLTPSQRARINALLGKSQTKVKESTTPTSKGKESSSLFPIKKKEAKKGSSLHDPVAMTCFLNKFTKPGNLKYTTHEWDEGDYTQGFDYFVSEYTKEIDGNLFLLNVNVYNLVRNFLCPVKGRSADGNLFFWGKNKIKLGYQYPLDAMREWMKKNPGCQPAEMPLSFFPEEHQPQGKENRSLKTFGDIIQLFKRAIEFRDDELYKMVYLRFMNSDITLDPCIEQLTSYQFFTSTYDVEQAVRLIAENIRQRKEHKDVKIYIDKEDDAVTLNILHVGSFSDASMDNPKLNLADEKGCMREIKSKLISLCDFYVESRFRSPDGNLKDYKIIYLKGKDPASSPVWEELPEGSTKGFKYSLKFYLK